MCGIAGVFGLLGGGITADQTAILKELAAANTVRGQDSTGLFFYKPDIKTKTELWYLKDTVPGYQFLGGKEAWRSMLIDSRFVVMHNRAATIGEVSVDLAHPFCETNVTGVHNGTVRCWEHLCKKLPVAGKMDSHAIITALSHADPEPTAVIDILRSIETGAYALVWYDKRNRMLRFARNEDRPMHMVKTYSGVWFASELGMLEWVLERNRVTMHQSWAMKPHVLVDVPIDGGEASVQEYTPYRTRYNNNWRYQSAGALLVPADDDDDDDIYATYQQPYHGGGSWWDKRYEAPVTRRSAWEEWEEAKNREASYRKTVEETQPHQQGLMSLTFCERNSIPSSIPINCHKPIYDTMCKLIGETTWHLSAPSLKKTIDDYLYVSCGEAIHDQTLDATLIPVHVVDVDHSTLYGYAEVGEENVAVSFSLVTAALLKEVKETLATGKEAIVYSAEVDGIRVYHHGDVALRVKKIHEEKKSVWQGTLDLDWNGDDALCTLFGTSHPERVSRIANIDWKAGWDPEEQH